MVWEALTDPRVETKTRKKTWWIGRGKTNLMHLWMVIIYIQLYKYIYIQLQGTELVHIPPNGKRKIIDSKVHLVGDMLVPRRVLWYKVGRIFPHHIRLPSRVGLKSLQRWCGQVLLSLSSFHQEKKPHKCLQVPTKSSMESNISPTYFCFISQSMAAYPASVHQEVDACKVC